MQTMCLRPRVHALGYPNNPSGTLQEMLWALEAKAQGPC